MENNNFTDEQINHILNQYKNKRNREKTIYHEVNKKDPEWCKINNQRAKTHYHNNKDKKKEKYQSNKEFVNARNMWRYYERLNRHNDFIVKHPDKVEYLKLNGVDCKVPEKDEPSILDKLLD